MKKLLMILSIISLCILCACNGENAEKVSGDTSKEPTKVTETAKKEEKTKEYPTEDTLTSIDFTALLASGDSILVSENGEVVKKKEEVDMDKFGDPNRYANVEKNPIVTMEMKDGNKVTMELYPQIAPNSVENFISLINQGFYDGVIFHRVMPNFMAQGGDPDGNGTGGPGYSIVGEFAENGYDVNNISHDIGVLSMARANDPDSAGSQFFIVTSEESKSSLDGKYAAFGKVLTGMHEVYDIVNSEVKYSTDKFYEAYFAYIGGQEITPEQIQLIQAYQDGETFDRPINPPVIQKMTVETFGVEYAEPNKLNK